MPRKLCTPSRSAPRTAPRSIRTVRMTALPFISVVFTSVCGESALHSGRVGGDVIELQRERDCGVHAHQDGDVGDAFMTEDLDRAVVQAPGDVAAGGQGRGELIS